MDRLSLETFSSGVRARGPANVLVWGPVVAWMAMIFVLSSQPTLPSAPYALLDLVTKKSAHFLEFAVLAGLCFRAFALLRFGPAVGAATVWALVVSVAYAGFDELHQSYVPNRHPQVSDVLVDTAGVLLALVAILWWSRRQHDVAK